MKTPSPGESYGQSYTAYQTRRSRLRQFIRRFYLARAASRISGPAIDYGCGAGDLLALRRGDLDFDGRRELLVVEQTEGNAVLWLIGRRR